MNKDIRLQAIRAQGVKSGVVLNPGTPAEAVRELLDLCDMVLIMTVEPGFGGQKFMVDMMPKVETVRQAFPALDIEVDGGLGPTTIEAAAKAGANMIVAGSSVFKAPDQKQVIQQMRGVVEQYCLQ